MQTNQLKRIHPNKKTMIVARGGKRGKTAGRGGKGQSARAGNKRRPEWRDIIKRLPKLRGRGKNSNKAFKTPFWPVNISILEEVFSNNDQITPTTLVEKGVVSTYSGKIPAIKILGDGEIKKVLQVSGCYISQSAKEKIIKAGGTVVALNVVNETKEAESITKSEIKTEDKVAKKDGVEVKKVKSEKKKVKEEKAKKEVKSKVKGKE